MTSRPADAEVHSPPVRKRSTKAAADIYSDGRYLEQNRTWHIEDSPWKARQVRSILAKNDLNPSSICEVGCGAGEILKQLSMAMPETVFTGYELSPQAFELCKARAEDNVSFHFKDICAADVFYDCLLCMDVFEHIEDYIGFLKDIRSKAAYKIFHIPLDISVASVLRGTMITSRHRLGHLHYFTKETALATLESCGYEIEDFFFTPHFKDLPAKSRKAALAKIPRSLLFSISPDLMVKLFGGCSLIVLSR